LHDLSRSGFWDWYKPFKAAFNGLDIPFDTKDVGSAANYRVMLNVVRPLFTLDSKSEFVGDALERWSVDAAHTTYDLTLAENIKFSNGDPVTAQDAVRTLERMMRIGKVIHYDFTNFSSVAVIGPREFRIILKQPDPGLLDAMTAPEFAPLHRSDYEAATPTFKITSGAYYVKEVQGKRLLLEKSPEFDSSPGPSTILVHSLTVDELLKAPPGRFDFFPSPQVDKLTHDSLLKAGLNASRLNIAHSFFVSMNAESDVLKDLAVRRYFQKIMMTSEKDTADYAPAVVPSKQLYLPGGPGRVSKSYLEELGNKIAGATYPAKDKPQTPLRLLSAMKSLSQRLIVDKLHEAGFEVNVTKFTDWKHYSSLINTQTFDLVEANNDFAGDDLVNSLRVTFTSSRPLIMLPKGSLIPEYVEKAQSEVIPEERYALVEKVEHTLLEDALIVPLYQSFRYVYLRDTYSLEGWNKDVSEIAFWKLQKL